jgi:hypothetical protein
MKDNIYLSKGRSWQKSKKKFFSRTSNHLRVDHVLFKKGGDGGGGGSITKKQK